MNEQVDVSVVICTYNRCDLLPDALESVLAQSAEGVGFEIVVVDNNSTDATREVVESLIARGHRHVRYVFEEKQGLSYARNTGVANARGPIIAFTDDDVRVASDWVPTIKRVFDEHQEVDLVGGKVLPRWETEPPPWLTSDHWAPLALTDYGDDSFYTNSERPVCLVGANLSCRRELFDRVGLFTPDFQRVKDGIGSTEDHELQRRVWASGGQGLYVPSIVVVAEVQSDRVTKAYHRRWHSGHGRFCSRMELDDVTLPVDGPSQGASEAVTLFGAPGWAYRNLIAAAGGWFVSTVRRRESLSFTQENEVRYWTSYIRDRYERTQGERNRSHISEIVGFTHALLQKKSRTGAGFIR